MTPDQVTLHQHVLATVGPDPAAWPGGWPDDIEAALIDAIFSVRARYGNRTRGTGVYGAVTRWIKHRSGRADNLTVLAHVPERELIEITNRGRLCGRTKAAVVIDVASRLASVGVAHSKDFAAREDAAKVAYLSVRGCGPVTWAYFRMLLGHDDVKPDTWVLRFVNDVLPEVNSPADADRLVKFVARSLGVEGRDLDHAIWRYRRARPPARS